MGNKTTHHHHYGNDQATIDAITSQLQKEYEGRFEALKKNQDENFTKKVMQLKEEYEGKKEQEVQKLLNLKKEEMEEKDRKIREEIDINQAVVTEAALRLQELFVKSEKWIDYDELKNPDGTPFTKQKLLGSGMYGEVYEGEFRAVRVAIKIFRAGAPDDIDAVTSLYKEYKNLKQLDRNNSEVAKSIAVLIGACASPELCLVTEFVDGDSLFSVLHKKHSCFKVPEACHYALKIAEAMKCIHQAGTYHRDLKSENIMISGNKIKMIDFGQAGCHKGRCTTSTMSQIKHTCTVRIGNESLLTTIRGLIGTPLYRSPENWEGVVEDWGKHDVFAFSMIMYELFTGLLPYHDYSFNDAQELQAAVLGKRREHAVRPTLPETLPLELLELIEQCWQTDPSDRPGFAEICSRLESIKRDVDRGELSVSTGFTQQLMKSVKPDTSARKTLSQSERIRQQRSSGYSPSRVINQSSIPQTKPDSARTTNNQIGMFESQLETLRNMGFYDKEKNLMLLQQYGGDIQMVVTALFS